MIEILKRIRDALLLIDQDIHAVQQEDGALTTILVFHGKLYKIQIKEVEI